MLFFWTFKKKKDSFHKTAAQVFSTVLEIINVFKHQISILEYFWSSCDSEDWSNGSWQFSFAITRINYILKYINVENSIFKL